ncbi:OadG family transporter subunit [Blautia producta]|nr:OadG family transporter subunit [Blautia producta]
MKQTWKKLIGLILIGVCVLAMTACGSSKDSTGGLKKLDDATVNSLVESFGSVVGNIANLDEESIASLMEGDDAFSASAASAWDGAGEDLGTYVETTKGEVEDKDGSYILTLTCTFEKRSADCIFTLDKNGNPLSVTIDPQYSMGEKMAQAGQNTLLGVGTVFVMLIFLCFVISLMKYIPGFVESFGKKKAVPEEIQVPAAPAAPVIPEAAEEEVVDDGELIAVIAAAIAASENTSTDSFVVRSIRKSTKRNWQRA